MGYDPRNFRPFVKKIEPKIKAAKDRLLNPLTKILARAGISANAVSLTSFLIGLCAISSLFFSKNLFLALILLNQFLDLLDGALARYTKTSSERGWWLDYTLDMALITLCMIIAAFLAPGNKFIYIIAPALFVLLHILYNLFGKKYQIIHANYLYYLIYYLNQYIATIFILALIAAGYLIISAGLILDAKKKVSL
jgi:phosphatidylglycerophosphate synthase